MKVSESFFQLPSSPSRLSILMNMQSNNIFDSKNDIEEFFFQFLINVRSTDQDAVDIAKFFLNLGVSINQVIIHNDNLSGSSPIHFAIKGGNSKLIEFFISEGGDLNKINTFGEIPLHLAVSNCNIKLLKLMIEKEAIINVKDPEQSTALHKACIINYYDCINLLISNGADLFAKNSDDETPLSSLNIRMSNYKQCLRLIVKNLSLYALDHSLLDSDNKIIKNSAIARNYFLKCTTELKQIENTTFFHAYTYLNILCSKENISKFAYLSNNEFFVKKFYKSISLFFIYNDDLKNSFLKILKYRDELLEIEQRLSVIFKNYFSSLIIRKLGENLTLKDLPL